MFYRDWLLWLLLQRIDDLVQRSCALPDAETCWEQRMYIDFELLLLYHRVAALLAGDQVDLPPRLSP